MRSGWAQISFLCYCHFTKRTPPTETKKPPKQFAFRTPLPFSYCSLHTPTAPSIFYCKQEAARPLQPNIAADGAQRICLFENCCCGSGLVRWNAPPTAGCYIVFSMNASSYMPLFFASNVLMPYDKMPEWLRMLAMVNPLSHTIDSIRELFMGELAVMEDFYRALFRKS